jgi:protein ImuB
VLWACLRFPQLALDALRIDADVPSPGPAGGGSSFRSRSGSGSFSSARTAQATSVHAGSAPIAIIDGPLQRRHVVIANAPAAKAGVRAGQVLAAAQMLCPRLATTPRDEAAERQTLESLAAWAYRYSAEIHIAFPDTLLVEVGSSLALFDGWAALERRLRHELADLGFACSLGAAPTAAGACVLATHRDGITIPSPSQLPTALGTVPLTASGLTGKTVAALQGMGFRTLADLFRLPRAELGRRIGEDALDHLDRMRGLVGEALPRWHPPGRFERRIEFNFGIETHTALAFPLQRLIRELALFLVTRDGGVQKFSLALGHERGASTRVEIGLLAPQRDAASLFDLARARLERIELAAPVHALGLIADDLPPLCPLHQDLFDHRRREELDWPALAERLRARLGDAALHGRHYSPTFCWSNPALVPAASTLLAPLSSESSVSWMPVSLLPIWVSVSCGYWALGVPMESSSHSESRCEPSCGRRAVERADLRGGRCCGARHVVFDVQTRGRPVPFPGR